MDLADVTAEIAAPADAVWAVVTDFAHPQRLAPTIARVELRGPVRIVHSSRGPVIHERVVERDAAAYRFRYAVLDSGDPPFAGVGGYVATVELTALSPVCTRIRWRSEGTVEGPVAPVREFLAGLYRTAIARIEAIVAPGAKIDRLLAAAVDAGVAPGFVAVVADAGGTLYTGAHGVTVAGGAAMWPDTVFWLASMTKLVTTVATMQLVEASTLSLDAPVAALLPELAAPVVLDGFDGAGTPRLRPARGAITLRHLLTHRSGIGYELMNPDLLRARGPAGPPPPTSLASLDGPLLFDPGQGWEYGFGIDWAGIAVERATGIPLDRYFADHIFGPLGMTATGFDAAPDAVTHLRLPDGGLLPIPSPAGSPADREFLPGGSGLSGTAGDYVRLLRMLLGGGRLDGVRLLEADTVAAMGDDQAGGHPAGRVGSASDFFLPYDPLPGERGEWCLLGLRAPADLAGRRRAASASWAGAAGTFFWLDRASGVCGVLLAQVLPFADPALARVFAAFEAAAYICNSVAPGRAAGAGPAEAS